MEWELLGRGCRAGSLGVETEKEDGEVGALDGELIMEGGEAVQTGSVGAEGDDTWVAELLPGLEREEEELEVMETSVGGGTLGRTGVLRVTVDEEEDGIEVEVED